MFQTVLMFLALPQNAARTERQADRPASRMATRSRSAVAQCRDGDRDERSDEGRDGGLVTWLTVLGNALGFVLLMTGLWLVLRLGETFLA